MKKKVFEYTGLSSDSVNERISRYGYNTIDSRMKKTFWNHLKDSLKDITIIILIVATAISTYVAIKNHPDDFTEPVVILFIVILNIYLSIKQQKSAEKSMSELKNMNISTNKVFRDNKVKEINSIEIVPDDVVQLSMGDKIPADIKLKDSTNLFVDESFLTGESEPTEKDAKYISKETDSIGDMKNWLFSGSFVVTGKGFGIVKRTGNTTEIGKISNLINNENSNVAPLQIKMQKLGKSLGVIAILSAIIAIIIGLVKGIPLEESLMVAISMAVAAIPEVLPVVVTISLAVGMSNMAHKKTIIQTPSTVETVGSLSIICSDKTGTITKNKMEIKEIIPCINFSNVNFLKNDSNKKNLLTLFYLSSDINFNSDTNSNPTELAIKKAVRSEFTDDELQKNQMQFIKINEIPFDSIRKKMTTIYKVDNFFVSITKGAFERLSIANFYDSFQEEHDRLASQAYRVLGVGYKIYTNDPNSLAEHEIESELEFAGFIGIIDPARPESYHAIEKAKKAGIKTIMITGDHLLTAQKIAQDVGILTPGSKVMTGSQMSKLTDKQLASTIKDYRVFARTSPEDKIRIVKAFQSNEEIVAMTGDGVNDAPALKAADVGIAMGGGTEVAKEASDMVLVDDNFATIIKAIEEGRKVYSNIRKSLYAMLGCNISALTIVMISLILGWGAPVTAIQLLIIKVVADGIPGFSLSVEPIDKKSMNNSPVKKNSSIFSDRLLFRIIEISFVFTVVSLLAILIGRSQSEDIANTMTFIVMGLSTIIHMYNCRSNESIFKMRFLSNSLLVTTTFLGALVVILLVSFPLSQNIFNFVSIGWVNWFWVILLSFIPLFYVEIKKIFKLY